MNSDKLIDPTLDDENNKLQIKLLRAESKKLKRRIIELEIAIKKFGKAIGKKI